MAGLAAVPFINSVEGEEEMEATLDPGLVTRPRRSRAEQNGSEEAGEPERSVYFDSAEGIWKCRHCTWTYLMENAAIDNIEEHEEVLHKRVNSKTISQPVSYFPSGRGLEKGTETKDSEPLADGEIKQEYNPESERKLEFENGFFIGDNATITEMAEKREYNSENEKKLGFEGGFPAEDNYTITERAENLAGPESSKKQRADPSQSEIKSDVPIRQINAIKEVVAEYDVEKVLEEQETHDLYCPNCHSCITKRVILHKRKRIGKALPGESQRPKRQIVGKNDHSDPVNPPNPDPPQEPEVFRCLSCFSFFISTASGFKLFRIFGRKEEPADLQAPRQTPAQDLNSVGSTAKYPGYQLQRDPQLSNGKQETKDVLVSQNLEAGLNSQRDVEIGPKVESSIKQNANGFQFFRIFGWRDDDQRLKTSQQDTILQTNSATLTPNDESTRKSPSEESDGGKLSAPPAKGNSLLKISHLSNGKQANLDPSVSNNHDLAAADLKTGLVEENSIRGNDSIEHVGDSLIKEWNLQPNMVNNISNGAINGAFSVSYTETRDHYINNQLQVEGPTKDLLDKDILLPAPESDAFHHEEYLANSSLKLEPKVTEIGPTEYFDMTTARVKSPLEGSEEISLVPSDHLSEEIKIGKGKPLQEEKKVLISSKPDYVLSSATVKANDVKQLAAVSQLQTQSVQVDRAPDSPGLKLDEVRIDMGQPIVDHQWDILKSIVYGGLLESLTSLGVVSSAAGSNATTLNIVVLALANLVGGFIVLAHNLRELISDQRKTDQKTEDEDRYYRTLGRRVNFRLHVIVAIISYIIFGMIPPIIYGFSFRKSDDKYYKLMAVAGASLFCILLLASGKAHVQQSPKPYFKTIVYYLGIVLMTSGLSYAVGELLKRAMEKTGLFDSSTGASTPPSATLIGTWPAKTGWESY